MPEELKELRRLDRDVLLITAVLWAAHFGVLVTRSAALGTPDGAISAGVRIAVSLLGLASTLAVYWLLRRRTMSSTRRFAGALLLCLPLCVGLAATNELLWLYATPYYMTKYGLDSAELFTEKGGKLVREATYAAVFYIWIYVSWCALYVGAVFAAQVRDRDRRLAIAQGAAHQAQLMALRFQLNPHFLFNTLNTLSGLVALDRKQQAESMILNLSTFLRYSLAGEPEQLVTLAREMDAQRMYLDIERVRFADRLRVRFDIGPGCEDAYVPAFLLQPLVENVIKHAVAPSEEEVILTVTAERQAGQLVIGIENSASTVPPSRESEGFGIGMANVRNRLAALFGSKASFEASVTAQGGWVNVVRLPWLERPADAHIDS